MVPYHSCIQHCNLRLHLSGFDLALQFSATVAIHKPLKYRPASLAAEVGSLAVSDICEQDDMQCFPRQACERPRFTVLYWLGCAHTRQTPEAKRRMLSSSLLQVGTDALIYGSLIVYGMTQLYRWSRTLKVQLYSTQPVRSLLNSMMCSAPRPKATRVSRKSIRFCLQSEALHEQSTTQKVDPQSCWKLGLARENIFGMAIWYDA